MASDVVMPRLSDSMEEGTVLKWLVEEGGEVKRGEPLVEIETDKANMTYEADTDGVLVEVIAAEGDTLAVGEVIARVGGADEGAGGGEGSGRQSAADSRQSTETWLPDRGRQSHGHGGRARVRGGSSRFRTRAASAAASSGRRGWASQGVAGGEAGGRGARGGHRSGGGQRSGRAGREGRRGGHGRVGTEGARAGGGSPSPSGRPPRPMPSPRARRGRPTCAS